MNKLLLPIILTGILLLVAVGCETSTSVVKLGEAPGGYTTLTHEGITLGLSYLDQNDLYKLYGQKSNPFVYYKTGRLIVIETNIQTSVPLKLNLVNAQLSTPGGNREPTPQKDVYDYWYSLLIKNYSAGGGKGAGQYHNWSLKITTQIINDTILPAEVDVETGSDTIGYILFDQIRGEKDVAATFTLPVFDQQGELLHEFEFQFPI